MNGSERYFGVLEGTAVDFIPRVPILMQFAAEHIGSHGPGPGEDQMSL